MIVRASVTNKIVHLHQSNEIVVKTSFNAHLVDQIVDYPVFRVHGFVMAILIAIMHLTNHQLVKENQHVVEDILNAIIAIDVYHKHGHVVSF